MYPWREKAEQTFPELQDRILEADTPYLLWFELLDAFQSAYDPPRNESLIERIYAYADWCNDQPRGETAADDLLTCVSVSFYEHIPQHPKTRADMPRWFSFEEFLSMEQVFRYHLDTTQWDDLKQYFTRNTGMYRK